MMNEPIVYEEGIGGKQFCDDCNAKIVEGQDHCPKCGVGLIWLPAKLAWQFVSPTDGKKIQAVSRDDAEAKYCRFCGHKLGKYLPMCVECRSHLVWMPGEYANRVNDLEDEYQKVCA